MRDIVFMGRVLASVTHDMQNVMAIVKESGCLVDDILSLNGYPRMKHGEKLKPAIGTIVEQVERGRNLMLMINGFAHAAGDFAEVADLCRFARQISVLAERMVLLKECRLQTECGQSPLLVQANAFLLMQAVYMGIAALLETCGSHRTVLLRTARAEHAGKEWGMVTLSAGEPTAPPAEDAALDTLMQQLAGLRVPAPGGGLALYFPLAVTPIQG